MRRPVRDDRRLLVGVQRPADGRVRTAGPRRGGLDLLDRRPLRRRRPLPRRLRAGERGADLVDGHALDPRHAARPRAGRRGLARAVARAAGGSAAPDRDVARAPAPGRLLEPRLRWRRRGGGADPGPHGRRLGGRLRSRRVAGDRRHRARVGAGRAVGALLAAPGGAGAGDRLHVRAATLVRPLAQGGRERVRRGAAPPRLSPRPASAAALPGRGAGPLGRRSAVARRPANDEDPTGGRHARAPVGGIRRLLPRSGERGPGDAGLLPVRRGARRRRRSAGRGRPLAVVHDGAAAPGARSARDARRRARRLRRSTPRGPRRPALPRPARRGVPAPLRRRAQPRAPRWARRPAADPAGRADARARGPAGRRPARSRGRSPATRGEPDVLAMALAVPGGRRADRPPRRREPPRAARVPGGPRRRPGLRRERPAGRQRG